MVWQKFRFVRVLFVGFEFIIGSIPHYIGGNILRLVFWRKFTDYGSVKFESVKVSGRQNIYIGEDCHFMSGCILRAETGVLKIGKRASVNNSVIIDANNEGSIVIEDDVLIGPNSVMRASNHRTNIKTNINKQGHVPGSIFIGSDVWIGANTVILAGSQIESGAVIAAGAVVNGICSANTIYGGVPAKKIGIRS
jgi:acetyltransferase-like isoleucine patch superfamily enzyme